MDRRGFLSDVARLAALAAIIPNDWRVTLRPRWSAYPFALGVASGDPTSQAVVIWTRLAPMPLEPDGGMTTRTGVAWEVADDDQFARVVRSGRATAAPELGYSVHIDVTGLEPDRWYFYRFTSMDAVSPVGRLRTAPAGDAGSRLRFAVVSCQHYEQGLYTAYQHLAGEELDLVTHLGDYIYEYGPTAERVRVHDTAECLTLAQYRHRYALYKSDPLLQDAHTRCPWIVTWDDHEVDNNYGSQFGENAMESEEQMHARRAAAYQAWWEHQPVRVPRAQSWADLNIVRGADWGRLARFHVLDSRQYRSDQACGDGVNTVPCPGWDDRSRSMLGEAQERWLRDSLSRSPASWQVLCNQTMLSNLDTRAGAEIGYAMDNWAGYPAARAEFIRTITRHARHRSVVLTGDNHANWVNEIRTPESRGDGAFATAEFLGTSISSGGDGADRSSYVTDAVLAENPHVRWQNGRRGYMVCEATPSQWRTEFRTVPFVSRPDAPVETASRWRLTHGQAGIERES